MNVNNIYMLNVVGFLSIGNFMKIIGDKVISINNIIQDSLFIIHNLYKLVKALE